MTYNQNYCGPFSKHKQHDLTTDPDGNVVCTRKGCGHVESVVCTCRLEPAWSRLMGCPKCTPGAPAYPDEPFSSYEMSPLMRRYMDLLAEEADRD